MFRNNIGMIYSDEIKAYNYGEFHPMKPQRTSMTYDLLLGYDLFSEFNIYVS